MKKIILALFVPLLVAGAFPAIAGLYLAPGNSTPAAAQATGVPAASAGGTPVSAAPASAANTPVAMSFPNAVGFGKNIPISAAIDQIVPAGCWKVKLDDGLEGTRVSWKGGRSWDAVLITMLHEQSLYAFINPKDCVIGVSHTLELAEAMANTKQNVWNLRTDISLRANLTAWAKRAGWSVQWDAGMDYSVDHAATLVGDFGGPDGVVAKVVSAFEQEKVPLKVIFYKGNNVIRIVDGGFVQGVIK